MDHRHVPTLTVLALELNQLLFQIEVSILARTASWTRLRKRQRSRASAVGPWLASLLEPVVQNITEGVAVRVTECREAGLDHQIKLL